MITLSSLDIFYAYFPLYGQLLGLSLSQIGWILSIQAFSNALVRVFMPRLIQLYGEVKILWLFMIVGAVAFGSIPFQSNFLIIIVTAFVLGAGLGVTQPLTIILAYSYSPQEKTAEVLGIRLASNRLAQTIIPFSLASFSNLVGLGSIFIIKSLMLFYAVLVARKIKVKKD